MRARALFAAALAALLAAACGGDEPAGDAEAAASATAETSAAAGEADDSVEVVGTTFLFADETMPTQEALVKYEAECPGKATPECKRLQWQLELALYDDLRLLARAGPLDDELLRVGAAADSPQLASFSLEHLAARGLEPEEHELVIAAFDSPYPLVRGVAQQLARQLPDEKWARMLVRDSGVPARGVRGLVAGVRPGEAALGAPIYPRATHWHFASSPAYGEFFTTGDDAEDVVEFYTDQGREALTGEQLSARLDAAKTLDPMQVAQKMQEAIEAGQSPEAVMASLTAGATGASVDWTDGIEGREGMIDPRYVVLAEEPSLGGALPTRVVAIFHDEAMGATGLIFRDATDAPAPPDLSTPEAMAAFQHRQALLASLEPPLD